jgi:hypothetical protein
MGLDCMTITWHSGRVIDLGERPSDEAWAFVKASDTMVAS